MALRFQYNKIALQSLNKQLAIRLRTLPTLKSKEATLRFEVERARKSIRDLDEQLKQKLQVHTKNPGIWAEFIPGLVALGEVKTTTRTIAGLKTPELKALSFHVEEFSLFAKPQWFPEGISILKELVTLVLERDSFIRKMELLNHARRKTTQKVNLYEKVQIPAFEDAIRKIKRFLEDEENLSKSAQKFLKNRLQTETNA